MSNSASRTYLLTYVTLLVLLAITVGIAELHLGAWGFLIAACIASLKALLIMLFFMHVRKGSPLVRLVAASGFFWLAILFTLTLSEYYTR